MSQSSNEEVRGSLLPGEAMIYERSDGVVYARYRDKPEIPRWIIGGDPTGVARAQGDLLDYSKWKDICTMAQQNKTLRNQLDKIVTTYYMIKDSNEIQ